MLVIDPMSASIAPVRGRMPGGGDFGGDDVPARSVSHSVNAELAKSLEPIIEKRMRRQMPMNGADEREETAAREVARFRRLRPPNRSRLPES